MTTFTNNTAADLAETFLTLNGRTASAFEKKLAIEFFNANKANYATGYDAMEAAFDMAADEIADAELEIAYAHGAF